MTGEGIFIIDESGPSEAAVVDSAELSCCVRALQQDLEELKSVNASLRKENHSLREQLHTSRTGADATRGWLLRPSCDAEFARALKVFYHSMTSIKGQLQRLRRHKPSVRLLGILQTAVILFGLQVTCFNRLLCRRSLTCWDSDCLWTNRTVC
ncbi:kinesin-like protein KIF28P [Nothobranchius furzeri]|uniref:Kinesin-like protein KIF28P n=1 Tax=Nothobranchius furzeri TaxID=105023 RepID=A0A9D2Y1D2_NOTFU|nr:kinesin-like protein KIF28P [Nothobranchius furzeri]